MGKLRDVVLLAIRSMPFRAARRDHLMRSTVQLPPGTERPSSRTRVLILGVYLADRPHTVLHLDERFASTDRIEVEQRWVELKAVSDDVLPLKNGSVRRVTKPQPKFVLINQLLKPDDVSNFDFIVVCDDDIYVPNNFLSAFIAYQQLFDLSVAQPARAWQSHFDHAFVLKRPGVIARETRYVECGPFVSFRRDAARLVIPFDASSPMWGIDLVWPEIIGRHGLKLGIVDKIAVDHSLRGQGTTYKGDTEMEAMKRYLAVTPHLKWHEAFTTLKSHRKQPGA